MVSRAGAAIQVFGLGEPSTLDDSLTWFLSGPHTVSTAINWLVILGLSFVSNSLGVSTEGGGKGKTDGGMGSYGGLGRGSYISWIVGRGRFNRWRWRWRRWRFLPCWHTAWMARADPLPLQNRDTEIYRGRLHAVSGSCRGRGSGGEDFCTYIEQRRAEHSGVESVLVVPPPLTDAKTRNHWHPAEVALRSGPTSTTPMYAEKAGSHWAQESATLCSNYSACGWVTAHIQLCSGCPSSSL